MRIVCECKAPEGDYWGVWKVLSVDSIEDALKIVQEETQLYPDHYPNYQQRLVIDLDYIPVTVGRWIVAKGYR